MITFCCPVFLIRFRYQDGHWYPGQVVSSVSMCDSDHLVTVEFKVPVR
jgi:hypothetical protein